MGNEFISKGFKKTEIGVFPEDWDIQLCSAISDRIMVGIVIRPSQYYEKSGIPALRSANIRENGINNSDLVYISEKSNELLAKSKTREGDLLTVRTGYPGTSAVVQAAHAGCNCIDILITRPSKAVSSEFLAVWVNSQFGKDQVLKNQGGLAQKHFNVGDMKNLLVALPELHEQRAIATALSDIDALIAGLDQLIAKKRALKQAAMQQLLTGQKRLPGFQKKFEYKQSVLGHTPEDWEVKPLKRVLINGRLGGNYPNQEKESDFPLIKMGNLARGSIDLGKVEFIENGFVPEKQHKLWKGNVLFNTRNTLELVGKVAIWRDEIANAYYNSNLMRLEFDPREIASTEYANAALNMPRAVAYLRGLATGTTSVAAIYTRDLMDMPIVVPPVEEQLAIAAILSDMDSELAALELRREKTRLLKQGMMQQLLTGRIRLVDPAALSPSQPIEPRTKSLATG